MSNNDPQSPNPTFLRRLMTPPLSYAAFLAAVLLIYGLSFFAGTLAPKKPSGPVPGTAATSPAR